MSERCPTCGSGLRRYGWTKCRNPWHDRAVQSPATPQEPEQPVKGYTLQALSNYFGWGLRDDRAIWRFIHERESLLRLCQSLLGTEKSTAQTAELAIRERVEHLSAPPVVWQDIETAPKDGTRVLVMWEYWSSEPFVAYFKHGRWNGEVVLSECSDDGPTHWMPLPSPPTPGGK